MFELRYRPGSDAEAAARHIVRSRYPAATSAYCDSGAIIYDARTDEVLGIATVGDWAVELAWQDAAARAVRD
jgi:hypothetical protein